MAKKQIKKQIKKQTKTEKTDKSKKLINLLKSHGAHVYEDLENGEFPKFSIPNRSISNIIYDKKLRQYVLGTNTSLRSSRNSSQLRSFTQLLWLAFFANKLTQGIGSEKSIRRIEGVPFLIVFKM